MRSRWSPSALRSLTQCPRRFALREAGWQPRPSPLRPPVPHAEFGRIWHAAAETFDRVMFDGANRETATEAALDDALAKSWEAGVPLGGHALHEWRCERGTVPSEKTGRPVQCPARKSWWAQERDDPRTECPKCGGPIETRTAFEPLRSDRGVATTKTRPNLLRAVLDYCDEALPGVAPVTQISEHGVAVGAPGLEVDLAFRLGTLELHCILDRYTAIGPTRLAHERKTSSVAPFWDGYLQTYQVRFYPEALRQNGLRCDGVLMEHYQILAGGTQRSVVTLTPGPDHITEAVEAAEHEVWRVAGKYDGDAPLDWPPRFSACATAAGGRPCEFLKVCRASMARRPELLVSEFEQKERGQ